MVHPRARPGRFSAMAMLKRFREPRAAVAVEFALVLPAMFFLLLAFSEGYYVLSSKRKIDQLAHTLADLFSQANSLSASDVQSLFRMSGAVIDPLPASKIAMRVTSVSFYSGPNAEPNSAVTSSVCWSERYEVGNGALPSVSRGSDVSEDFISPVLRDPARSWIVADVDYELKPLTGYLFSTSWTLTAKAMLVPRSTVYVARPGLPGEGMPLPSDGTRCR